MVIVIQAVLAQVYTNCDWPTLRLSVRRDHGICTEKKNKTFEWNKKKIFLLYGYCKKPKAFYLPLALFNNKIELNGVE